MKTSIPFDLSQRHSLALRLKSFSTSATRYFNDFRLLHNDVQVVLVLLALFILPGYILAGHFFDLLTEIQLLMQGYESDSLLFVSRTVETGIILYSFIVWLYYHLGSEQIKKESQKQYRGAHPCIQKSFVPVHLLNEEHKPDDEFKSVFNDGYRDLGSNEDEFLAANPEAYHFLKDQTAYKEAYERTFGSDTQESVIEPVDGAPRYVSLFDQMNEFPEDF